MSGIAFPAAPTILSSAHDLVDVNLSEIPPESYTPPEVMVASLGTLPRLKYLTFGPTSYPGPISLPLITRTVLPALTTFCFDGPLEYFEYLVALIDTPRLCCLQIEGISDSQIPQLCMFIDRSEQLRFSSAVLIFQPYAVIFELNQRGRSSIRISVEDYVICQVVNQLSAMLSNVDRLLIGSEAMERDDRPGYGIPWLELFWPFTAVKALCVDHRISWHILQALEDVTDDRVAEVLPAMELLCLEYESVESTEDFVTARQDAGRPVTVVNREMEFQERLKILDDGK
ncbi:hypothetical protein EDB86DRAFT_3081537 [Lactarius hatsudake]|nr:hypothetical protein EDB86DRAFT_3081537 [Lactarius hatsudake]